ncbi:hypothetical protein D9M69_386000 [compost metagenome]
MVTTQSEFLHFLQQSDPRRAGWQRAAHSAGMFFLGPLLGGGLLLAFGFVDTLRLVAAGLLLTVLVGDRIMSTRPQQAVGVQVSSFIHRLADQYRIVRVRRDLRQTMCIEYFGQSAMAYFTVFVILVGIREFGMGTELAAGLISLQGGVFVTTLLVGGGLLMRHAEERRYLLAFVLILAAQALLTGPYHPALPWLAALLFGVGLGIQHLTSVMRFADLTRTFGRGRVAGLFSLAGPAGGVSGAVLGGVLSDHLGLFAGFRVLAALYLVLLFFQARELLAGEGRPVPDGGAPETLAASD